MAEYAFAQLAHAAMESFASESAARLAAMQSAREKLEERQNNLRALERRLRQEQITSEVLEIWSRRRCRGVTAPTP